MEREHHLRRIPAIAVTALARQEDRERALAAGFDAHITKPVNPDGLIQTVVELVRTHAAGRPRDLPQLRPNPRGQRLLAPPPVSSTL